MSVTITDNPKTASFANQKLVYTFTSTNVAQPKFKFIVQVYYGATEVHKCYIAPNAANTGVYDLSAVARTQLSADVAYYDNTALSIHSTPGDGVGKNFSRSLYASRKLQVRVGEYYEVSGVAGEQVLNDANHDIYTFDGKEELSGGYQPDSINAIYSPWGAKTWLTDRELTTYRDELGRGTIGATYMDIPVDEDDWGVQSFIHDETTITDLGTSYQIQYDIYKDDGTQLGTTQIVTINATQGAGAPTSTHERDKLIHLGCYPKNLSYLGAGITTKPSSANDWGYYTIHIENSTNITMSYALRFYKNRRCAKDKARIAWQNTLGGWDYFNFSRKKETSYNTERKRFRKVVGDYSGSSFSFNTYDRGLSELDIQAAKILTVTSDWMTTGEFTYLASLIQSKEVHLVNTDGTHTPMILEDTNYTAINADSIEKSNLVLKFKYAQGLR